MNHLAIAAVPVAGLVALLSPALHAPRGASQDPGGGGRARLDVLYPPAEGALVALGRPSERSAAPALAELLAQYVAVTGISLELSPETAERVQLLAAPHLGQLDVPAGRVHATVQALLSVEGLVLLPPQDPGGSHRVEAVHQLASIEELERRALPVDEAELEALREHAAVPVSVTIRLEHLDAPRLAASLNPLWKEPWCAARPAGERGIVLSGLAPAVHRAVRLCRMLDRPCD